MIEINLLPGARRSKGPSSAGVDPKALLSQFQERAKDAYFLGSVAVIVLAVGAAGWLFQSQASRQAELDDLLSRAVADSQRYAMVIADMKKSTIQRDSVLRQFKIIRAIDGYRYVWAHLLDEVSANLPGFTWITEVAQAGPFTVAGAAAAPQAAGSKGRGRPAAPAAAAAVDTTLPPMPPLRFRLSGVTVDIQALTRYMRDLEASPFIRNVTLVNSQLESIEGRDVTKFSLDAEYEVPPPSAIVASPLSIRVQ